MVSTAVRRLRIPEKVAASQPCLNERETARRTILVATADAEIRGSLAAIFERQDIRPVWATGMEEIKQALAQYDIAACFSGFWLVDGTYRDVVRHLKRQNAEIPVVVVCGPGYPEEYGEYLAALNIRRLDVLRHPYQGADIEKILNSMVTVRDAA